MSGQLLPVQSLSQNFFSWAHRLTVSSKSTWLWYSLNGGVFDWCCRICEGVGLPTSSSEPHCHQANRTRQVSPQKPPGRLLFENLRKHGKSKGHNDRCGQHAEKRGPHKEIMQEVLRQFIDGVAPCNGYWCLASQGTFFVGKEKAHRFLWLRA